MNHLTADFVNSFLLVFGIILAIAGIFTIYFGAGKSRKLGAGVLVLGIASLGLLYWLFIAGYTDPWGGLVGFWDYIRGPVMVLTAGVLGAIISILIFIGVITKA